MKKTREEKRVADLRRQRMLSYQQTTTSFHPASVTGEPLTNNTLQFDKGNTEHRIQNTESRINYVDQAQKQSIYIYPVQLIRQDLTKTLVLCILAISLELGLYFLLEKPGLLPF